MTRTRSTLAVALATVCLLGATLSGCRENVVSPGRTTLTLSGLWPNDDGRWWRYNVVDRTWADEPLTLYPSPDAVPPAPTMDEIAALIDNPPAAVPERVVNASYELRFSGTITTLSGVTKQNLVETLIRPGGPAPARPGELAFLADLARARPDLRARLRARFGSLASVEDTVHLYASTLLHGYAWEKTPQWIGTYGDVDTLLAWKYLTDSLTPGSEFTHQLVPSLASDVWLHGRILEPQDVRTMARTFPDAIRCAYLIDYGVMAVIEGSDPLPTGYTRFYGYGFVAYVSGVGPVACYERRLLAIGGTSLGVGDVTLDLSDRSLPFLAIGRD